MVFKKMSLVLFLSLQLSFCAQAERLGQGTSTPNEAQASSAADEATKLPFCFDGERDLELIVETMRMNPKNKFKYDGYKKVFRGEGPDSAGKSLVSDQEAFARLVYAETLAANCKGDNSEASKMIAEVISNRVEKRNRVISDVVFELDQFASSLNNYSESKFKELLCPKDLKLWESANKNVKELLANPKAKALSKNAFHYYFFLHSTRFKPPAWTRTYKPAAALDSESKKCLEAYHNPSWK